MTPPLIGLTMGDPVGVGPEIIAKVLADDRTDSFCRPLVLGDEKILARALTLLGLKEEIHKVTQAGEDYRSGCINVFPLSNLDERRLKYGCPDRSCGEAAHRYIEVAVRLALEGKIDAITTAPVNKGAVASAGFHFVGHTEFLAEMTNTLEYVMMLAGERLRVALVTTHCSLRQVPDAISVAKVSSTIRVTSESMRDYFGLLHPRVAVAALNPHAGEGGLFGWEEEHVIRPAVQQSVDAGFRVEGPLPADTLFFEAASGKFDAVICMYHDQGLIPLKLLHFDDAVNVTLGLPVIRTSVDHGTAYDIAGTGKANPKSLFNALRLASHMASVKRKS